MGIASWYEEHVVPRFIKCACSSPAIAKAREKVVPLASGAVFEIGCGGGINQGFYDPALVSSYAGLDPSGKGLEYARAEAERRGLRADIRQGVGEDIPFGDESFDTVVCTFTLCSVGDQAQTIRELRRILKPGGRLLFAEHGRAPDASVRKWQDRIEPVWKRLAGGCHLTRPISSEIVAGGFSIGTHGERYAPKTPRWAGWMEWGEAMKAG
ncbi:MAG: class I SAM-dependent methyltransferase [Novosphingobium sp.]|uniref:class I SAM-dependent methyltransferase n=1 Tax=Novosphingobium sp. TaxID=1874826 RepID=UPI001E18751A|nr:class I SAM-dependent methyltransferase [Novosphingobium sp.]MCB2058662.1 class I SAM-dependent methyltransferase [Novosphingobium sp.]MCP5387903.1 class I SAM-dependent methyltransferase [Novosphingobium sp.]